MAFSFDMGIKAKSARLQQEGLTKKGSRKDVSGQSGRGHGQGRKSNGLIQRFKIQGAKPWPPLSPAPRPAVPVCHGPAGVA